MPLTALSDLISRLPQVAVPHGDSRPVFGLLRASRPAVAAALAARNDGPVVVITAHPHGALDMCHELSEWTDRSVAHFPAVEALPFERVRLDRNVLAQRETVVRDLLGDTSQVIVAPVRALMQPVRGADGTVEPSIVQTGDTVQPDVLLRAWVALGYSDVATVEEPGTFARRGGVIDVFPGGEDRPFRIELFGNEVDSIRTFDPSSQRSVAPATSLTVSEIAAVDDDSRQAALDSLLAADTSAMTAEATTAWLEDLARLEAGAGYEELNIFAPYLIPHGCSLLEHLPANALVILDGAGEVWSTAHDLWDQANEVQTGMVQSGTLPPDLPTAILSPDRLHAALADRRTVEWHGGSPTNAEDVDWSGLFVPEKLYAGRVRDFVHDLAGMQGDTVVVVSAQHERIAELLADEPIALFRRDHLDGLPHPGVTLVPHTLLEGWCLPSRRLHVFTDHELFGRARTRPIQRKPRTARDAFFTQYSPGDYVVHLEHGIGRFESVTRMAIDGVEREYAVIQYAGTDRVYVPTDQLERLTRYIGVGDAAPQLNKLGGGEWQRARTRAQQAAADIAKDLIDLYSRRRARAAHAFSQDSPWQHELESSFAYPETPDQSRAIEDVKKDMEEPHPHGPAGMRGRGIRQDRGGGSSGVQSRHGRQTGRRPGTNHHPGPAAFRLFRIASRPFQ